MGRECGNNKPAMTRNTGLACLTAYALRTMCKVGDPAVPCRTALCPTWHCTARGVVSPGAVPAPSMMKSDRVR